MDMSDISVPEIYKESQDFRFFLEWFKTCITKIQYDTENLFDCYDPLRCPQNLLWALGDTIGYKYDNRLPAAFNRLVLIYFMSMIRNKGSKDGVTLAAEVNLAQFNLLEQSKEKDILNNRLEDTSIPVNSVYVNPVVDKAYIDVVYFSDKRPLDACIEYVRPLGLFLFQHAGVRYDAKTKISIDSRLTNESDVGMSFGPTQVGHYNREDYARMQKVDGKTAKYDPNHIRRQVWATNSKFEGNHYNEANQLEGIQDRQNYNPGYRALYSLQLSNNEQIVKSLISPIFDLGYTPTPDDVSVHFDDGTILRNNDFKYSEYYANRYQDKPVWNLRYNQTNEEALNEDISTVDDISAVEPSALDISNWSKNFEFEITNEFNSNEKENIMTYTTVGGYERFYHEFEVEPNTNYVFSFDFCCPTGFKYGGYSGVYDDYMYILPCTEDALSKINEIHQSLKIMDSILLAKSKSYPTEASEIYDKYELNFNTGENTSIYIVFDFGQVKDGTITTFKLKNMKLVGHLVFKPVPAVNPMMMSLGDAISMSDDNSQYTENDGAGNITIVNTETE
jgi:hypothetical protein